MAARYDDIGDLAADWHTDQPDDGYLNALRAELGMPPVETAHPNDDYL